jgi:hypothetical protein
MNYKFKLIHFGLVVLSFLAMQPIAAYLSNLGIIILRTLKKYNIFFTSSMLKNHFPL